jgi:hypothetical protein
MMRESSQKFVANDSWVRVQLQRGASMVKPLLIAGLMTFSFLAGCHRVQSPERARLTAIEIRSYERRASEGDAQAAKRLWQYFEGPGRDSDQAERWKDVYETLQQRKESSSSH